MKYATWTWPDIGEGRPHTVVAEVPGAVETPDGLVDAPVLVTACGRTRPAEGATVVEGDAPENLHETCAKANGRLLARGRNRSVAVFVVESPVVLGVPEGAALN